MILRAASRICSSEYLSPRAPTPFLPFRNLLLPFPSRLQQSSVSQASRAEAVHVHRTREASSWQAPNSLLDQILMNSASSSRPTGRERMRHGAMLACESQCTTHGHWTPNERSCPRCPDVTQTSSPLPYSRVLCFALCGARPAIVRRRPQAGPAASGAAGDRVVRAPSPCSARQ